MPEEKCRIKTKPLELNRETGKLLQEQQRYLNQLGSSDNTEWMLNNPCVFSKAHWWICSLISNKAEEEFLCYGYSSPHEKIWTLACFPTHLEAYLQSYLKVSNDCKSACRSKKIILQTKQTFAFKRRAFMPSMIHVLPCILERNFLSMPKDRRLPILPGCKLKHLKTQNIISSHTLHRKKNEK